MFFQVSYPFSFRRMLLSCELDMKVRTPWLFRILRVILGLMGIWLVVTNVLEWKGGKHFAVAALALVTALFAPQVSAVINFLSVGRLNGTAQAVCGFSERMIISENMRVPVHEVTYDQIRRIVEYRGCYFLITERIGRSSCMYMLPKEAFVSGDAGDFSAFISEKTGKPVEYIK